jgi:gas vesicle protein
MGQEPEALRGQLATKREELAHDLEAIGDRVSPGRMVERRQAAVRMRFGDVRERVMGTKDSFVEHAQDGAHSATSTVTESASRVGDATRRRAEGSPLGAGLVAFGAGVVAAALFPSSSRERQLAEKAQPAVDRMASEMGPAAKELLDEVKPAAEDAMHEVRDDAKQAAANVSAQAKDTASELKGAASTAPPS